MGLLVGLAFGIGVLLMWQAVSNRGVSRKRRASRAQTWLSELIAQAGIESVRPGQVVTSAAGLAGAVFIAVLAVSASPTVSLAFAIFGAWMPFALLRWRQRQR